MIVVVIGLGSMGKRRIRLIQKYNNNFEIIGVDTNENRRKVIEEDGIISYENLIDASKLHHIDCAFICTSPLSHSTIITQCLKFGYHVFTELNLVDDGYDKNSDLAKNKDLILFVSSTMLYREEVNRMKKLILQTDCKLNYTYHVGQYLPDWHPWENYKDFFVGEKKTNGCRELFAIELPWLVDIFGKIESLKVTKNKISSLKIDYNDNYLLIVEHDSGHKGVLLVDVVSRKAVRNFEVFGELLYLQWDGTPQGLKRYNYLEKTESVIETYNQIDQLDLYSKNIVENAYLKEIETFFKLIYNDEVEMIYDFCKDKYILSIIDEIEKEV